MHFSFKLRLLDFTTAVRYEGVDMDTCFLSEKPKPVTQPDEEEILSEMQMLPISFRSVTEVKKVSSPVMQVW